MVQEVALLKNEFRKFEKEMKDEIQTLYFKLTTYLNKIYSEIKSIKSTESHNVTKETEDLVGKIKFPLATCEEVSNINVRIQQDAEFKLQLVSCTFIFFRLHSKLR